MTRREGLLRQRRAQLAALREAKKLMGKLRPCCNGPLDTPEERAAIETSQNGMNYRCRLILRNMIHDIEKKGGLRK